MSAQHWNSGYLARDQGPYYCGGCQQDWPCPGSLIEASERETQRRIADALERGVLLRDTPEDRERLARIIANGPRPTDTAVPVGPNEYADADAIIAALRGEA